jgi:hypothetical protein
MTRLPFRLSAGRLSIAGVEIALTVTGEVEVAGEVEDQLGGRGLVAVPQTPRPLETNEARRSGRPSKDALLSQAIAELGRRLDRRKPRAAQARRVLRHLAETPANVGSIPTQRCVEAFLAKGPPSRKNSMKDPMKNRMKKLSPAITQTRRLKCSIG